jgi:anti-anti-sigma factor
MRDDVCLATPHFQVRRVDSAGAGDTVVLTAAGELDAYSSTTLLTHLLDAINVANVGVVLDLGRVTLVSAAGARTLSETAATLAESGRRLLLARCHATVRDVIRYVGAPHTLPSHPSVAAALAASRAESRQPVETEQANGLALLRQRARNLPVTLRTRPLIAGTIDELRERYELSESDAAFTLLRRSSQRYNLKLHTLALAFLSAPPARPGQPLWFGGRHREAAPSITFTTPSREWPHSRGSFLGAVLRSTMSIMDSEVGYLQLADHFLGGLQLESQHGLPDELSQSLSHVGGTDSACGAAFDSGYPTTRSLDHELDPSTRNLLHREGLDSVHSVPLLTEGHPAAGVVSTLHRQPATRATPVQADALNVVATQSAAWLDWYQQTVVLDALEHLHNAARQARAHCGS